MELTGKTIAITGVGGFIGFRMAEMAKAGGMTVKGLDLSEPALERVKALGADCFVGDITSEQDAARLCEGADIVFHTAAIVEAVGEMGLFRKINVGGAKNMAEQDRSAGDSCFVHLSSVMVYGFQFPRFVTEDGPLRGENNPYCQTKIESEAALGVMHDPGNFDVIVIRPGDVYGPGSKPWVTRPASFMAKGMFVNAGGAHAIMNHVYIDNLIDAVMLAIEKDAGGETFNVTDDAETTFADYFSRLSGCLGRSYREVPIPVMRALLWCLDIGFRLVGKPSEADSDTLNFMLRPEPYSVEKAKRVLGYSPTVDLDEGMRRVKSFLDNENWLPQ